MGGFFGVVSKRDAISDVFFGTDYHSHLGTKRGGMAAYDPEIGLQRDIHNIENSPFRTKFDKIFDEMKGNSAIGCISDSHPQPLLIRSNIGTYAISIIGAINNDEELCEKYLLTNGGHFGVMTGGKVNSVELVASLINHKKDFCEGIKFAQEVIDGSASILILKNDGTLIAARDRLGRLPIIIGKNSDGYSVSFESFAFEKLGYEMEKELGPGEIVQLTPDSMTQLSPPGAEMRICAFLWTYYGYSTSTYEDINVEVMRYKNGQILAQNDKESGSAQDIDYVCGVPDSGTPHAIGYANESEVHFARPFIKYTPTWPRSFTPS
ncbi:MAG: amidophosphoribosyltransferase, partial [Ruminococcus sp.]|nr:amidophosphoribosyltransferase [Ruminococcus sp.]